LIFIKKYIIIYIENKKGEKSMKDALGDRMKGFYEDRYRVYLTRRMPVIIRVDGNAFHTFTRGLDKPFDYHFMRIMQHTCKELCEFIQGCVGGYVQSDEISLLLVDYNTITTDAWFDYNLQKGTSLAAARATLIFNRLVGALVDEFESAGNTLAKLQDDGEGEAWRLYNLWEPKQNRAIFDARAFNIPKEEVTNYFIWRQKDATRNSIQAAGQAVFRHSELNGKSQSNIQEMLFQKGINWNNYSIPEKRGSFVRRYTETIEREDGTVIVRHPWYIDDEMPVLTEDRDYIEELVNVGG
jgi:tRNA(His) 5'-end guanylyltransferase